MTFVSNDVPEYEFPVPSKQSTSRLRPGVWFDGEGEVALAIESDLVRQRVMMSYQERLKAKRVTNIKDECSQEKTLG